MSENELMAIREEVIESIERSAEVYGLSRSAGRVYGILYFSGTPLSIPELVERTGYAKSTISNVTRRLTRIGMIRRRSSSGGGRRVHFEAEMNIWIILQDVFQQYIQREMQASLRTLDRAQRRLNDLDREDETLERDRDRIRTFRQTYEDLQEIVELTSEFSSAELREALETYEK